MVCEFHGYEIPLTGCELPLGWRMVKKDLDGAMWENKGMTSRVAASVWKCKDGKDWLLLWIYNPKRMPTYNDLVYLKRHWVGDGRKCLLLIPPLPHSCLQLLCRIEGPLDLDFIPGLGAI